MALVDKIFRRKYLLGKANKFSALYSNTDFQDWKANVVDTRLAKLSKNVLNGDPDSEEGQKKIMRFLTRYQELKFVTEGIFKIWQSTEDRLRKEEKVS